MACVQNYTFWGLYLVTLSLTQRERLDEGKPLKERDLTVIGKTMG
jgi:hypothetical protein